MIPPILIYAELLYNIRQVSVDAYLSSPSSLATFVEVSAHGFKLRVQNNGIVRELTLPAAVKAPRFLPVRQQNCQELSWRLPLLEPENTQNSLESIEDQSIPWSASTLVPGCELRCRICNTILVQQSIIKSWRDLPSENWAEMMEFWHCHKPAIDGHRDSDHLASRGYGANATVSAQQGVGLVDLTSFLLCESDCSGVVVSYYTSFTEARWGI